MTTVLLIAIPLIALGLVIVAGLCVDAKRGDEALERDRCDALLGLRARDDLHFRPTGIQILGGDFAPWEEDTRPRPVRRSPMQGETNTRRTGR